MRIHGIFCLAFLQVTSATAQDAMVVDFCGIPGIDFSIRDGNDNSVPIARNISLGSGTQVEVKKSSCEEKSQPGCSVLKGHCYVTLKVKGNQDIRVTQDGFDGTIKGIYKVEPSGPPVETGILQTGIAWFGKAVEEAANYILTMSSSKGAQGKCCSEQGEVFSIPLLDEEKGVLLKAGEYELSFGWQGGQQPYQVKLYVRKGKNKELVQSENNIRDKQNCQMLLREAKFDGQKFEAGESYVVEVTDMTNTISSGFFTVVSADKVPKVPDGLSTSLKATWLAEQGSQWGLQGYQEVASGELMSAAWSVKWSFSNGNLPPPKQ